jgi:hypothetical protein
MAKAATALRAYAEREKELVEALEKIELLHYGDKTFEDDARSAHIIARAILSKHKVVLPQNTQALIQVK